MNIELALRVKARILEDPGRVDMIEYFQKKRFLGIFPCGSTCCIAGHCIEECGGKVPDEPWLPYDVARELLGIPDHEAQALFFLHRPNKTTRTDYSKLTNMLAIYKPGSKEYAQIVAQAIDICIERSKIGFPEASPKKAKPATTTPHRTQEEEDVCTVLERESHT